MASHWSGIWAQLYVCARSSSRTPASRVRPAAGPASFTRPVIASPQATSAAHSSIPSLARISSRARAARKLASSRTRSATALWSVTAPVHTSGTGQAAAAGPVRPYRRSGAVWAGIPGGDGEYRVTMPGPEGNESDIPSIRRAHTVFAARRPHRTTVRHLLSSGSRVRILPGAPSPAPVVDLLHGLPRLVRRSVLALSGSAAEEVVGRDPQRVGVRQVRVGRRHPVDELGRGGAAFQRRLEVGEVAAAFADLAAGVVVGRLWVAVA